MRKGFVIAVTAVGVAWGATATASEPLAPGASRHETEVGVNILQSSYSRNWNGGDKGSLNWAIGLNSRHEKQVGERFNWRNTLKLAYGQNHQQQRDAQGGLYWQRPDKSTDAIEFESLGALGGGTGWEPYFAVGFSSLFRDLSDGAGRSQHLNPLTFRESIGLSRRLINEEKRSFTVRAGLALVQSSRSFFSEPAPSTTTISETAFTSAAEIVAEYRSPLLDGRVAWESMLSVDRPLTWSGKSTFEDGFTSTTPMPDDIADYSTAFDLDWENSFSANITRVISVKLLTRWVYDKYDNSVKPVLNAGGFLANEADVLGAVRRAGQFKQSLALGLSYKF
jgi:hypothetical protein